MSDEERKQRFFYRANRKKWITIMTIALASAVALMLLFSILSAFLNKTYYVNYQEQSDVNYGVHLKDNDFYEETFLGKEYSYVAALIDSLEATFKYDLLIESDSEVSFDYAYRVESIIQITEKHSGRVIYAPVTIEAAEKQGSLVGNAVSLSETVLVDYVRYNEIADRFVSTYKLSNVETNLILKMVVDVTSASDVFSDGENTSAYVSSIRIPLTSKTVEVSITSDVASAEQRILSHTTEGAANAFRVLAIVMLVISVLIGIAFVVYIYLSRNMDVTYEIKVSRILSAYKSFIQRLRSPFNTDGYQVLALTSFNEMLDIRDTVQSPILMYENEDKTCATFFIPTQSKTLYLYEIKVDDYDQIYGDKL